MKSVKYNDIFYEDNGGPAAVTLMRSSHLEVKFAGSKFPTRSRFRF